jgi:molybdenum cofactor cytidylyltransferase
MSGAVGILLAAGSARRFGVNKLMQPLADGTPVGVAAADTLVRAMPNSLAVVRPDDHLLVEALSAVGLKIVENPFADQGMGTSLATGVRAAAGADGWLIALADMPWVHTDTMLMLAQSISHGASMVAPVYRGRRGNPAGFSRRWGNSLRALSGDQGARELFARYASEAELFNTEDEGVVLDVDRPTDLARRVLNPVT